MGIIPITILNNRGINITIRNLLFNGAVVKKIQYFNDTSKTNPCFVD
jgi:hypothetical protein